MQLAARAGQCGGIARGLGAGLGDLLVVGGDFLFGQAGGRRAEQAVANAIALHRGEGIVRHPAQFVHAAFQDLRGGGVVPREFACIVGGVEFREGIGDACGPCGVGVRERDAEIEGIADPRNVQVLQQISDRLLAQDRR